MKLITIGDVVVHAKGESSWRLGLMGADRKRALRAFRDGADTSAWDFYDAPYCGPRVPLTDPSLVDWERSGL
jgi:hypothetical protein